VFDGPRRHLRSYFWSRELQWAPAPEFIYPATVSVHTYSDLYCCLILGLT